MAAAYEFALRHFKDGNTYVDLPLTGTGMNKVRLLKDLPYEENTVILFTYLPNYMSGLDIKVEPWYENSLEYDYDFDSGDETLYIYINYSENYTVSTRPCDISVSYVDSDGYKYTEYARTIQSPSDGSNTGPQIITNITQMKFKWDGTAEMSDSILVNWVGSYSRKSILGNVKWITTENGVVQEGSTVTNMKMLCPITVDVNDTGEARSGLVEIRGTATDGTEVYSAVTVIQGKQVETEEDEPNVPIEGGSYIGPIWKDVEYDFGSADMVEYAIYKDGTPIFYSRSNKRPNALSNTILVNKICQNYFKIPELNRDTLGTSGNFATFKLTSLNGQIEYKTYHFVNDWSYTTDFKTGCLSHPILNERNAYYGQYLPFSVFGAAEQVGVTYGIKYKNGYTDEYDRPVEDWYSTNYAKNSVTTSLFPIKERNPKDGVKSYVVDGVEYELCDNAKVEYVLYYINPWGGYDWFPIMGKVVESDELVQYTYNQNYNNTTLQFGKRRYLSEIHKKFELNTHWLREEESKRMWYLIQSNTVYLHNLKTDEVMPVIITDTKQEHKKRGLISNRISYQINVELSQTRERL